VTVSNCDIDGRSTWSATCDGRHYWNMLFLGSNDMITLKNNYIHSTSGRAPKIGGNSLVHVVNNYWYDNSGHAFELSESAQVLIEGNVFQNVKASMEAGATGQMFATGGSACSSALGRNCQINAYGSSTTLTRADTGFLANFRGKNIAAAGTAEQAKNVVNTAGFGRI
jgi:pectin lyase